MTPTEFLSQMLSDGKPVFRYLAELFIKNGYRFTVTGWGFLSSGGPLGTWGLEQDEALWLLENGAYFHGLCDGMPHMRDAAMSMIREELQRIEQAAIAKSNEPVPQA